MAAHGPRDQARPTCLVRLPPQTTPFVIPPGHTTLAVPACSVPLALGAHRPLILLPSALASPLLAAAIAECLPHALLCKPPGTPPTRRSLMLSVGAWFLKAQPWAGCTAHPPLRTTQNWQTRAGGSENQRLRQARGSLHATAAALGGGAAGGGVPRPAHAGSLQGPRNGRPLWSSVWERPETFTFCSGGPRPLTFVTWNPRHDSQAPSPGHCCTPLPSPL